MAKPFPPFTGGPFEYDTQVRVIDGEHVGRTGRVVGNIQDQIIEVRLDGGPVASLIPDELAEVR